MCLSLLKGGTMDPVLQLRYPVEHGDAEEPCSDYSSEFECPVEEEECLSEAGIGAAANEEWIRSRLRILNKALKPEHHQEREKNSKKMASTSCSLLSFEKCENIGIVKCLIERGRANLDQMGHASTCKDTTQQFDTPIIKHTLSRMSLAVQRLRCQNILWRMHKLEQRIPASATSRLGQQGRTSNYISEKIAIVGYPIHRYVHKPSFKLTGKNS
jgi:hypothetical protein